MFFRIVKIISFFTVVAVLEVIGIFLYCPSLIIDAYRGDDETSIWVTARHFDFQRKISDTDNYKFDDLQWSPNGRFLSYYDYVALRVFDKEWALKVVDVRFFLTKTIFIGDYHTSFYDWLDDNTIKVCAGAGSGVKQCRVIDINIKQPIVAVDNYDSGNWNAERIF